MDENKEVTIYSHDGTPIRKKSVPELDPDFLKSWYTLFGGAVSDIVKKVSEQPYATHSFVYAVVSAIAGNISRLEPVLYRRQDPETYIFEHAVLDLFDNPNPLMTGVEFREAVLLNLLLPTRLTPGGQCFIIPSDKDGEAINLIRGDIPEYLYPFSDEMVKPKVQNYVFVGWEYVHPSGQKIFYYNDQIIRIRLFNPYNWLLGLSPLSALQASVLNDAKHAELSDKVLDNSANIGGLLTTDAKLNKLQAEALKNMWHEQYEGLSKAGKTALLHSGLRYENTSKTLVDIQFTEQRKMNREEIMAVYGVGKTILGLTEGVNRATAKVEKEMFWEDTLIPYIDKFWNGFNSQFIKYLNGREFKGTFDMRHIEALKRDVAGKIKSAHQLIEDGVPAVHAFETVDLVVDTKKSPWLSEPLVTKPRINLATGETIGSQSMGGEEPKTDGELIASKILMLKDTAADDKKLWQTIQSRTVNKPMAIFKSDVIKFFVKQRNKFQDQVDAWLKKQNENNFVEGIKAVGVSGKGVFVSLGDFLIPITPEDTAIVNMATPIYTDAIGLQVNQMADELGGLVSDFNKPLVNKLIKERADELKKINNTTFKKVEKGVLKEAERAVKTRMGIRDFAKNIKKLENDIYKVRIEWARVISRTEISAIASRTRVSVMKNEGIKYHRWMTAQDGAVRQSHRTNAAQGAVKVGEPFANGMIMPLGFGPPEEVVNCRCVTRPVIKK